VRGWSLAAKTAIYARGASSNALEEPMAWIINRTGQPEGPYEDGQIVQWIQSGQLTGGQIAQPGTQNWVPLGSHAPFAEALRAMASGQFTPGGYPAPPGGGYPPAGQYAQGYTAPGGPVVAQAGAPYGSAPQAGAQPKKKGGGMGIVLALVGAALVIGAGVFVYLQFFSGPSSKLSTKVPKDVEIYFEIPSLQHLAEGFAGMGIIDEKELDGKKLVKDVRDGMKDAFDIKKEEADELLASMDSVAFAARDVTKKGSAAVILGFSDAEPVEKLLKSTRFNKEGELAGGTQYSVERVELENEEDFKAIKDWSPARKFFALGFAVSKDSKKEAAVWYPDAKLFVIGDTDLIEDIGGVVTKDKENLASNERWKQAEFASGSSAIFFVDSGVLKELEDEGKEGKEIVKGYFDDVAPFAGSIKMGEAGIVASLTGELKGTKVSEDDAPPSAVSLDLYEKLPKETILYLALSSKSDLDGKEQVKRILKQMKSIDEGSAEEIEKGIDEMDKNLGIGLAEIFDAIGDQMIFALAVDRGITIDEKKKPDEYIAEGAAAYLLHVGDKDKAKKVVKTLREKLFEEGPLKDGYDVDKKGEGFDATPKEEGKGAPEIRVRLTEEHLLVVAGGMSKRFTEVLDSGKESLGDDDAHGKAIDALGGKPHAVLWADTGFAGRVILDFVEANADHSKELEEAETELGVSTKALRLKGKSRMTSAVSIGIESDGAVWRYRVDTLNLPALAALGGFAVFARRLGPKGPDSVQECKDYFAAVESCKDPIFRDAMRKALEQQRESWKKLDAEFLREMCKSELESTRRLCQ
jgi:hypothetical protein